MLPTHGAAQAQRTLNEAMLHRHDRRLLGRQVRDQAVEVTVSDCTASQQLGASCDVVSRNAQLHLPCAQMMAGKPLRLKSSSVADIASGRAASGTQTSVTTTLFAPLLAPGVRPPHLDAAR